eukprot:2126731-Alexandrium_andersonii.AAC.1
MSRSSVGRWEGLLCDNIMCASHQWYTESAEALQAVHSDLQDKQGAVRSLTLEVHVFSGDATNSSTVQSLKAQACEVTSTFWLGVDAGGQPLVYTSFCDVQHLPPNCGGAEMHA